MIAGQARRRANAIAAPVLCGLATAAVAQEPDTPLKRFVAAVAENGCSLAEADAPEVLARHGMSAAETEPMAEILVDTQLATLEGDVLTLSPAICDAPPALSPLEREARLIGMIGAAGCSVALDDIEAGAREAGLSAEDTTTVLETWAEDDLVRIAEDRAELAPGLCGANGIAAEDRQARLTAFLDVLGARGCTMTEDTGELLLPAAGFSKPEVREIANQLIRDGKALLDDDTFTLNEGTCP